MARPARGLRRLIEASLAGGARAATHRRPALHCARPCAVAGRSAVTHAVPSLSGRARWSSAPPLPRVRPPAAPRASRARHAAASSSSGETLVIVESPAKAVSVQKYLGDGHVVLASYGHVRDLVEKSGSVVPERGFEMVWEERARDGVVRDILRAARSARTVVLATDPDREGEAIAWHILELLKREGVVQRSSSGDVMSGPDIQRVTFTEVTKSAVRAAFAAPRDVSAELVDAYLARRALDYLFGFSLSGVLWRKMPSAQRLSAGRVQSVALRLVCDREFEIEKFRKEEYWSVRARLTRRDENENENENAATEPMADFFAAELTHVHGLRLGKMEPGTRIEAEACAAEILEANDGPGLVVHDVTEKDVARNPKPPFTTSTMQQEASSKLGFGAGRTMSAAQSLYEGRGWGEGLITYMRTDGLHVSPEAVAEIRATAAAEFGQTHVPASPNVYKKKQKNAQEAHEAIRPTSAGTLPSAVANRLGAGSDEAKLYRLIWARTMASQMAPAVTKRVVADVRRRGDDAADPAGLRLRANGSRLVFAGHLAAYGHGGDGGGGGLGADARDVWLPELKAGESVRLATSSIEVLEKDPDAKRGFGAAAEADRPTDVGDDDDGTSARQTPNSDASFLSAGVLASQHWTQPPGRYTEGTLVKALEEKGIGRPSTYASILRVITKRGYVTGTGGRGPLVPETRGRLVSSFLSHFFAEYVDYGFTAGLEDALDDVANGEKKWRDTLGDFWGPFQGDVESLKGVRTSLVVDVLDATLGVHFFGDDESALEHRMRAVAEATEEAARDEDLNSPYPTLAFDPKTLSARRKCPSCADGRLGLKLSRTGGFIGCSNYPACGHTQSLSSTQSDEEGGGTFPKALGTDPVSGRRVSIRNGPYGPYLELEAETLSAEAEAAARAAREMQDAVDLARLEEEAAREAEAAYAAASEAAAAKGEKPPRRKKPKKVKLPKRTSKGLETSKPRRFGLRNLEIAPEAVTLDLALDLLTYPKTLGAHPEDGEPVVMNAGPFGWYVSHAGVNASLPKKLLRDERRRAAATARGEPGDADDAADDADAKAWALAAIERADDDEAEDVFVDEGSRDADAERSGVDARDARDAAALRALFGPVSLAAAVDVLTRKRSKPAGEGRGRWGRKKKGAEEEGKADSVSSARSASGSSTKATTASAAEKKSAPKPPPPQKKKRAPSSYMLYCAEARASLPAGLKVTEQAKLLGASWKALSDVERTRFEAAAEAAKAALASEAGVEGKPGKTTKKRAPSAYLLYCAEARASLPEGLKVTEQAKLLGAAWKSLEASERSKFERAAAEAKEAATA